MDLPYAEDVGHYWQTSMSSPETWIERAKKIIVNMGGEISGEGFGAMEGKAAYMLKFEIGGQGYKVVWPVLPSDTGRESAARRQAATMLFHDIKAKAMAASVLGTRAAFFNYLALPDGRVISEMANPELSGAFPKLLT